MEMFLLYTWWNDCKKIERVVSENKKSAEIRMLWQKNDLNGRKMNQ